LTSPKRDGANLVFSVKVLEGDLDGADGPASVFIDINATPRTRLSVAGVARRTARRRAFYNQGMAAMAGNHSYYRSAALGAILDAMAGAVGSCGYHDYRGGALLLTFLTIRRSNRVPGCRNAGLGERGRNGRKYLPDVELPQPFVAVVNVVR
jgi:hypothetical protein